MLTLLVAACLDFGESVDYLTASPTAANPASGTNTATSAFVVMRGLKFDPPEVTIKVGGVVTFVMEDTGTFHEVLEGRPRGGGMAMFKTPKLVIGQTHELRFDTPGEFEFFCSNHSTTMRNGLVTVEE